MTATILTEQEFAAMMDRAREKDAAMARSEASAGFASPSRCDIGLHLRTADSAIECAIKTKDWPTACEGLVLLRQAIARIPTPRRN
jgi:hypothetical protein